MTNINYIEENSLINFKNDITHFENFIRDNIDQAYTAAFVYQIQPIEAGLPPFIIHIEPTVNGKAGPKQVQNLHFIRAQIKNSHVIVFGYAFDGDREYSPLHHDYFDKYIKYVIESESFLSMKIPFMLRIVSDPLHILKRARYRLLRSLENISILSNFDTESIINLQMIQDLLKLPTIVFNNNKITKMHDTLPGKLFTIHSLQIFIENKYFRSISYFLPWCLIQTLFIENINSDRVFDLLEIAFFFLLNYYENLQNRFPSILEFASETKNSHKPLMVLFDGILTLESLNFLYSVLCVFISFEGKFNINHMFSTPLEHTFGKARMRAKYFQTLQGLSHSMAIDDMMKFLRVAYSKKIRGRINKDHFLEFHKTEYQIYFDLPNKLIAFSLCCFLGIQECNDNSFHEKVVEQFFAKLFSIENILEKKKIPLTLNQISLGVQNGLQAKSLIRSKHIIKNNIFDQTKNKLDKMFLHKLKRAEIVTILQEISRIKKIPISHQILRNIPSMLEWFDSHWDQIYSDLYELASSQHELECK